MADEIEVMVDEPEEVESCSADLVAAAGADASTWTWQDSAGAFLRALEMEDNVMFVILSVLVLIASMNIISGLVMLVKNKGRDIGILRTMGLTEGSVLRVFFLVGASTGLVGTAMGVVLGVLFAIYIDPIFALVDCALRRRGLGPVGARHLPAAGQGGAGRRALGGGAVARPVVRHHPLPGPPGGADEPGGGAAL